MNSIKNDGVNAQKTDPLVSVIKAGELYSYQPYTQHSGNTGNSTNSKAKTLRIMTWNILRGYQYQGVIAYLQKWNPDIVILNEVDWGNIRTDQKNIAQEIANALSMNYIYGAKGEEIISPFRNYFKKEGQGGGVIGNAILSKYEIQNPRIIQLDRKYEYKGPIPSRSSFRRFIAPQKGNPIAVTGYISIGDIKLHIYGTHLELFNTGIRARRAEFETIVRDAKDKTHVVITGDMNTAAHGAFGIYNMLENLDAFWLKNIFTPEGIYWKKHILPTANLVDPFDAQKDWTLKVGNIYHAKLDWIMTRGCIVISHAVGSSETLQYSDHKPLIADIEIS